MDDKAVNHPLSKPASTETRRSLSEAQISWLRQRRASDRGDIKVAALHREMKKVEVHLEGGSRALRAALVEVGEFDDWVTDLVRPQGSTTNLGAGQTKLNHPKSRTAAEPVKVATEPPADTDPLVALVAEAKAKNDLESLVRYWLLGSAPHDKQARKALDGFDEQVVHEQVSATVEALLTPHVADTDSRQLFRRLSGHYKRRVPSALRIAVIRGMTTTPEGSPDWINVALPLVVNGRAQDVAKDLDVFSETAIDTLLTATASIRLEPNSLRDALYRALVLSGHWRLLAHPDCWRGGNLESIAALTGSSSGSLNLLDAIAETVLRPEVAKATRSLRLWQIFQLVGSHAHLAPFIDPSDVLRAAARSDESAQLFNAATEALRTETRQQVAEARDQAAVAQSELKDAKKLLTIERERSASLAADLAKANDLIQRLSAASAEVSAAQIRQGRVDALRVLIDLTHEIRNLAALDGSHADLLRQLLNDAVRHLDRLGVEVVGTVGERRSHNPALDESVPDQGSMVEVLSPAYVLKGDTVIALRRALTSPVSSGGG